MEPEQRLREIREENLDLVGYNIELSANLKAACAKNRALEAELDTALAKNRALEQKPVDKHLVDVISMDEHNRICDEFRQAAKLLTKMEKDARCELEDTRATLKECREEFVALEESYDELEKENIEILAEKRAIYCEKELIMKMLKTRY